ncbi:hypothetical protein [Chelativorans sp. J32]|uniref:hypothetical protein n=1 Tax=Chelativorans sp. J32 TaxID=935840 RepID=UPI0004815563|nr:hypothetical protein [Chelativorans sp. J32]
MRKLFVATSALLLMGAGASLSDDLPPDLAGNQEVDASVTTGSIGPLRYLTRGEHMNEQFRTSDEDNLPYSMRQGDLFDNEIHTGSTVAASPVLRPLAGQETQTPSVQDENLPPQDQTMR